VNTIFSQIGIIIAVATFFAVAVRFFKQPPLVGYVLAGITLGPLGLSLVQNHEILDGTRQVGLAFLLFLVGMELDWKKVRQQLSATFALSLIQVLGSFTAGFLLALLFGQDLVVSLYIGTIVAFTSTVLVVKVLSESRDLSSLHGRLSVGILLFQDVIAIMSVLILTNATISSSLSTGTVLALLLLKGASLVSLLYVMAQYVLPYLFKKIARSSELLFLASISWCFAVAISASLFDFPIEVGAFLAGISLASLPYSLDIMNRLRSVRDFFVILLFVSLGSHFAFPAHGLAPLALALIGLVVIVKPIVAFLILNMRGFRNRTSFIVALTQGQLSEFSILAIEIGLAQALLPADLASMLTFVAIVSLFLSTLTLTHRERLYAMLRLSLKPFERKRGHFSIHLEKEMKDHIILFGYHRMGYHIFKKLGNLRDRILVVDFNPEIVNRLRSQGVLCVYGDIQDEEIMEATWSKSASMIISTVPHREETLFLLEQAGKHHTKPLIIVTSHNIDDALEYYKLGADYVILPHLLGGEFVGDLISQYEEKSLKHLVKQRAEEVKLLRARKHALYYD
jgi:Kef-type K+ transport system membrane component KefB